MTFTLEGVTKHFSPEENRRRLADLEERIKTARSRGSLYHPTNPIDAYYCDRCCVFGKGADVCWSCGEEPTDWQNVPRWGGGAHTVQIEGDQL